MRAVTISVLLLVGALHAGMADAEMANARMAKTNKAAPQRRAAQKASPEEIYKAFDVFCQEWMKKLAAREHDNIAHIKWDTRPDGVEGAYVAYNQEHTCVAKNGDSEPVGRIAYQEVLYAKRGKTIAEAQQSPAQPVETTAVTELFRYDKGKWIY